MTILMGDDFVPFVVGIVSYSIFAKKTFNLTYFNRYLFMTLKLKTVESNYFLIRQLVGAWQNLNFQSGFGGKEGGDLFKKGCSFHIKNKLKTETFNDKKSFFLS